MLVQPAKAVTVIEMVDFGSQPCSETTSTIPFLKLECPSDVRIPRDSFRGSTVTGGIVASGDVGVAGWIYLLQWIRLGKHTLLLSIFIQFLSSLWWRQVHTGKIWAALVDTGLLWEKEYFCVRWLWACLPIKAICREWLQLQSSVIYFKLPHVENSILECGLILLDILHGIWHLKVWAVLEHGM